MLDTALDSVSSRQHTLNAVASVLLTVTWAGIINAQSMFAFKASVAAAHCSLSASWNTVTTENATMAAVAIVAAGASGYVFCHRKKNWGKGTLIWLITLCAAFTLLIALMAWVGVSMLLNGPVMGGEVLSEPLTGIAQALTVVPGLAAVSTLVVCWVLRRSNVRPAAAAWQAALVPVLWFVLAIVVQQAATAAFCN